MRRKCFGNCALRCSASWVRYRFFKVCVSKQSTEMYQLVSYRVDTKCNASCRGRALEQEGLGPEGETNITGLLLRRDIVCR